ncbi:MAG: hypothetical protein NTV01_01280 [Bacteroidia bacterium]|nr:hypothetical protein [Bacteroidia bacterium]
MPTGYTRSPKLLKGALVKLGEGFLGPIPNIIVFQYNPEKLSRQFTSSVAGQNSQVNSDAATTGEPFDPQESFTITLELDAADALENPETHPVAAVSGVADRIAAMEMLVYPVASDDIITSLTNAIGLTSEEVPRSRVPVVLFIWGPGRILPVRITSFSIDEQAFSPLLFPVQATVTLGLKVLKLESFPALTANRTLAEDIAVMSYKYTKGLREILARANLANSAESILAMLPF